MSTRRILAVVAVAACSVALFAACGGGTSSSDKTKTAEAGVGGVQATPVASATTAVSPTAAASPTTAAATAEASPSAAATTAAAGTPAAGGATSVSLSISTPDDTRFDKDTLTVAAGASVTLTYTNDSDLPHNWHLFDGSDASAPSIAQTQIATGPNSSETVTFTAPTAPGRYYYHCDVHPQQMTGFLVVQ